MAERHVHKMTTRVDRQRELHGEMVRDDHSDAAQMQQTVLDTVITTLVLAIKHPDRLCSESGRVPDRFAVSLSWAKLRPAST
jgi:hypothetical protein